MTQASAEKVQVNVRMPRETVGHLDALARDAGISTPQLVLDVAQRATDEHFMQLGREAVIKQLRAEHEAEVARYNVYFDELEARYGSAAKHP